MTAERERIAAVVGTDSATIQALFVDAVARWRANGVRVAGMIEEAHGLPNRTCSGGVLRDIASGAPYPIYLETVPENTSCHLDAQGAETACSALLEQIAACDLVVLSKFGKLEAAGGGLTEAFQAARAAGKPVLTTVSDKHREAWGSFAPEAAFLRPDATALQDWWQDLHVR